MKLDRKFLTTLFFCLFYLTSVFAIDFKKSDIKIIGNKSISKETILNYIDSKKDILSTEDLNSFQKKLFETNFFSKVELKLSGNEVSIYLTENPLIEFLFIQGLEKRDDLKKAIENIILLKENNIFSETLLNNDSKAIYKLLSDVGYFKSLVDYKVNKLSNGKVNIFFDILLNQQFFVKNIFFVGDKKISTSALKSVIATKESSWLDFINSSAVPSVDKINYDISSLKTFYLKNGYYDVQIANGSIDLIDENYVNVIFAINAGNKYVFAKSTINNKAISLKDKDLLLVSKKIKTIEKEDYNPDKINTLLKFFTDYFDDNAIAANIDYTLNKKSIDTFEIIFEISDTIEKRFVNNIKVKGNDITEETVIRNKLYFSEGDLFSQSNMAKSLDALKALNFFKKVNLELEDVKNSSNVNVNVLVEEQPTGEVSAGAGYGSEGAVINFSLNEKNFLGKGMSVKSSMLLGTQKVLGNVSLINPDFTDNGNSLKGSFFVSKYTYDNAGYENKVIGSDISTSYEALKNVRIESGLAIDLDTIKSQESASTSIKSREGDYLTTKLFYNVFNDRRNRKFEPTSGYTTGFGQGFATLASDIPYVTNSLFGSAYKQLGDEFVGTAKFKIKSINSLNDKDVKLSDRIFLSDSELRGFVYRGVGPKLSNEYVGGNYSYSTNFSTTVPNGLPDSWGTKSNIFLDVANIWGSDFPVDSDSNTIRSSAGVGFQWVSPMGPISFTYAEPISKHSTDGVENFNFKLGGIF
tara:strand:+ start:96 stop:2348 length:2253 start_codon:yes stop_codon:yes gene_type:complete